MFKKIGYIMLASITLSGCQSISDKELEALTIRANKAQFLQVEKDKLVQEKQNLAQENKQLLEDNGTLENTVSQLNEQLKQEIINKQVQVEYVIPNGSQPSVPTIEEKRSTSVESKADNIKITMQQGILFPSGSYKLGKSGREVLKKVAQALYGLDDALQLRIVGHSDNMPVSKKWHDQFVDNWDLSARRSAEIARYMIWSYGFAAEKISIVGRADVEPIASNKNEQGRAKNRRIELFIEK
ncbi:MAG: OmpA family protein [Ghiorsea sp.]